MPKALSYRSKHRLKTTTRLASRLGLSRIIEINDVMQMVISHDLSRTPLLTWLLSTWLLLTGTNASHVTRTHSSEVLAVHKTRHHIRATLLWRRQEPRNSRIVGNAICNLDSVPC